MSVPAAGAAPTPFARRLRDDLLLAGAVAIVAIALHAALWQLGPMRSLEGYTLDLRMRLHGPQAPGDDLALVLIDERSIADLGRWPWNRTLLADGIARLTAAGARVVVLDLLFSEPDASLPPDLVLALRRGFAGNSDADEGTGSPGTRRGADASTPRASVVPGIGAADAERLDADAYLARAMERAGNVLVPFALSAQGSPSAAVPETVRGSAYRTVRQGAGSPALTGRSVVAPVPIIAHAAVALGHVNVVLEPDGAARFAHPVVQLGETYHPALAVQAARVFLGHAPEEVRLELGRGLWIGAMDVPTDASMRTVVRYYGPDGTFPEHSFSDLMHGKIAADELHGRIVLVGAKAQGLSDRFRSAFTPRLSGTERTATVIANLLRGEGLVRRAGFWLWDLALALTGGLLLALLAGRLSAYALTALAIAMLGAVFAIDYLALVHAGAWLGVTLPGTVISAIGAALVLAHHLHQSRLARAIRGAFGRYLHPELVRSLIATGFASAPGSREATVLFADLAGFTSMAEEMSPEQVVRVLNEYFSAVTEPIERHHGLVTQYQGDALLAVFNVPFEYRDHAAEAVRAAREILAVVRARRFGGRQLAVRIGINTGPVVAGSVGSPSHLTYTVHGDAVNLAARLEALNKEHGTALLIAGSTASRLGEGFDCTPAGTLPIRGKREAVSVYRVEP